MYNELQHHGTKGQKWGKRRFQNKDGSLTAAGRKRYSQMKAAARKVGKTVKEVDDKRKARKARKDAELVLAKQKKAEEKAKTKEEKRKKSGKLPDVSTLSDQELKNMLNRLDNEKRYAAYVNARENSGAKGYVKQYAKKHGAKLIDEVTDAAIKKLAQEIIGDTDNNNNNGGGKKKKKKKKKK